MPHYNPCVRKPTAGRDFSTAALLLPVKSHFLSSYIYFSESKQFKVRQTKPTEDIMRMSVTQAQEKQIFSRFSLVMRNIGALLSLKTDSFQQLLSLATEKTLSLEKNRQRMSQAGHVAAVQVWGCFKSSRETQGRPRWGIENKTLIDCWEVARENQITDEMRFVSQPAGFREHSAHCRLQEMSHSLQNPSQPYRSPGRNSVPSSHQR